MEEEEDKMKQKRPFHLHNIENTNTTSSSGSFSAENVEENEDMSDTDSIETINIVLGEDYAKNQSDWSPLEESVLQYLVHAYKNKLDERRLQERNNEMSAEEDYVYDENEDVDYTQEEEEDVEYSETLSELRRRVVDDSNVDWLKVATHFPHRTASECEAKWIEIKPRLQSAELEIAEDGFIRGETQV